jgi:hypothetical protein
MGNGVFIHEIYRLHTRCTTVGRIPLDRWSVRHVDLYLSTHNTHNTQTFTPQAGFEPRNSAGKWPYTYTLDHTATGTGIDTFCTCIVLVLCGLLRHLSGWSTSTLHFWQRHAHSGIHSNYKKYFYFLIILHMSMLHKSFLWDHWSLRLIIHTPYAVSVRMSQDRFFALLTLF